MNNHKCARFLPPIYRNQYLVCALRKVVSTHCEKVAKPFSKFSTSCKTHKRPSQIVCWSQTAVCFASCSLSLSRSFAFPLFELLNIWDFGEWILESWRKLKLMLNDAAWLRFQFFFSFALLTAFLFLFFVLFTENLHFYFSLLQN